MFTKAPYVQVFVKRSTKRRVWHFVKDVAGTAIFVAIVWFAEQWLGLKRAPQEFAMNFAVIFYLFGAWRASKYKPLDD